MRKFAGRILIFSCLLVFLSGISLADSIFLTASDFDLSKDDNKGGSYYAGDYLHAESGSTYNYFSAPVHLPHGAQITSIVVRYLDNTTGYVHCEMQRRNMYKNFLQLMCSWSSSGELSAWQSHKITDLTYWTVNNSGYGYIIWIYFSESSTSLLVEGIRINYNLP
jgi:hypothetical protein